MNNKVRKKLLFILSGNLSTTPRALKTIMLLNNSFECKIVTVNRGAIWKTLDKQVIDQNRLNVTTLELGRMHFWSWFCASICQKMSKFLSVFFANSKQLVAYGFNKSSIILNRFLKHQNYQNVDLILGYSEGGLYPTYYVHKKYGKPFILDVEDYHPGEQTIVSEKRKIEFLLKEILPEAAALTISSTLIKEEVLRLVGKHPKYKIVHNGFDQSHFNIPVIKKNDTSRLRLVWFGQKIDYGRGLEDLFITLSEFSLGISIQITLIGKMDEDFYQDFLSRLDLENKNNEIELKHIKPMMEFDLFKILGEFDVGIAYEKNNSNFNRQICLTNKIFAYSQAGLYVLASNTKAQKQFISRFPDFGIVIEQSKEALGMALKNLYENRLEIKKTKSLRFDKAKVLSWNHEQNKIQELLQQIL